MPGETQSDPIADAVAGLAGIPAGPALATSLAALDLKALSASQCVDVLKARYRQDNHERGQLFAVIEEVMLRTEAEWDVPDDQWPVEFASVEVRAALVLTRNAAENLCALAQDVLRRLPAVQQAFAAGVLDQPRVRVFSSWTLGLSGEHTKAIVAALLPRAHLLTTAQLIQEIQRHAIALDPNWARRRYERALKGRRVVGSRNPEGTANLAGYDLPVDQVEAACARLDRLAKATKQAGHPDPIDHVRSHLFLGMSDGSFEGLTDPQILARLLAEANLSQPAPATEPAHAEPANEPPEAPAADDRPDPDDPADNEPTDDRSADDQSADERSADDQSADERSADESSTEDKPAHDPAAVEPASVGEARPAGPVSDDDGTNGSGEGGTNGSGDPEHGGGGPGQGGGDAAGRGPVGRTSGLRLLVRLATLAGADQRPGDLIGSGPVHAELARTIANTPGASWWYVITGPDGAPLSIGQIRARPHGPATDGRRYPGLQVWVQVNQTTLDALARQTHPPGWDRVLAEITAKADTNTGPPNGDPTARLPGAALRRWITIRDHTCVFPGFMPSLGLCRVAC